MTEIHSSAVIDSKAKIGEDVIIGPGCVIGRNSIIGKKTVLDAGVVIGQNVEIGENNQLYAGCVIGRSPQALGISMETECGKIVIGNNNLIREQCTVHAAMEKDGITSVGDDNMFMVGVHLGHDVTVEDKTVMVNYCQVGGHGKIETGVWFSGMVATHQFVTIGKWAYAAGFTGINHDIPPYVMVNDHYPPKIRAINKRGLTRAGLTEEEQKAVFDAFRILYRQRGGTLLQKAQDLLADSPNEHVSAMCQSIINGGKHRYGRYLEQFRGDH